MSQSKADEYKTSFNNNPNFIPIFASQEPYPKFCEPNDSIKKDYLKSMYQFVTLNENKNFDIESSKESQLPNYIVPVLYVPHRIVTNEELQNATPFYPSRAEAPEEIPKQSKKSKVVLSDSESKIYQRLTNKLRGMEKSESNYEECTRYKNYCSKNASDYNNPNYAVISNSEICLTASTQNKTCPIPSASATSNDVPNITDNTQKVSDTTTNKNHPAKHSIKRVHSNIPSFVQAKLNPSTDLVSHLQSKPTQTKFRAKQISTQTGKKGEKGEDPHNNDDVLLELKCDSKNFSSCTNISELLEDDSSFKDEIEIEKSEDLLEEVSFIPVISSPLDEIMTPKLRTHSKIY